MTTTMRVLLIEDNEHDVHLIRRMLRDSAVGAFDLEWSASLEEGVERLRRERYDVVLLDLNLPECDGPETLDHVLEATDDVPVIALTGAGEEARGLECVQRGAQDYLDKGKVSADFVTRTLRYAHERFRLRREHERSRQRTATERERALYRDLARTAPRLPGELLGPLVEDYGRLLRQVTKTIDGDGVDRAASELAARVAVANGGSSDVAHLHLRSLEAAGKGLPPAGSVLVLARVLAALADCYRRQNAGE